MFGLYRKMFNALLTVWVNVEVTGELPPALIGNVSLIVKGLVPPNCPVVIDPIVFPRPVDRMLNPSCVTADRSTSAKRTCSRISPVSGGGTSIMLVTLGAAPLTTSKILSATTEDEILPVMITTSFDVSICTFSLGKTS